MHAVLRSLGRTIPAVAATLVLAACGGSTSPTAPQGADALAKAPSAAAAVQESMTIRGVVRDQDGRLVANAQVECMGGDVTCTRQGYQLISQDGPDEGLNTDASGAYNLKATSSGSFLMNAHLQGYKVDTTTVEFPQAGCTAESCTVTVNFRLEVDE